MTDTASVVLKVDATSVDKGAVSLDQLTAASVKTDKATAQLNEQQRRAAEFMKGTATATTATQNTTTQYIAALEKLIASHDKGASASQAYDNAVRGATKAQKDHIDALIQSTQVHQQTAGGVDMLTTAFKALGGAYAMYKVGQYIGEAALLNAKYELLGVTMTQVGKNVGYTAAQMDMAAEAMQREGINMMASREAAIKMVQAHIDLTNASKLAKLAQDAAIIGNINAEEALLRLTQGIMVGRTQTLKLMGLNVDFELGYRQMASTLNKTTAELSENEKTQSRLNQVLLKGTEIAGANEAAMGTAAKQMILMKSYAEDLKVQLGGVFNEILTVAVLALTKGLENANGEVTALARNGQLKQWGADVADTLAWVTDMALGAAGAFRTIGVAAIWSFETVRNTTNVLKHPLDTMFGTKDNEQGNINSASDAMLADIRKSMTAMRDALKDRRLAIEKEAELTQRALAAAMQYPDAQSRRLAQDNHRFSDDKPPPKTPTGGGSKSTAISEYERLFDAMEKTTQAAEDEAAANGKLSESDKYLSNQLATLERAYANSKITMDEWSKLYDKAMDTAGVKAHVEYLKELAVVAKTAEAAEMALHEANLKRASSIETANVSLAAGNLKLAEETEMLGKSKEAINAIEQARLSSAIAIKEEQLALKKNTEFLSFEQIALEEEIKLLKERATLRGSKAAVEADAEATKAQLDSQLGMWNSINNAAQSTFVNIFEGGKNAFDKLKETLKSGLLALLYEMTVKRWIFQIFASVTGGGSGLAQAAGMGGGGDLIGTASNANSLYSAGSNIYSVGGQYLGGTMSGANAAGTLYANASTSALMGGGNSLDALLATNGAYGTAVGAGTGAAAGAYAGSLAPLAVTEVGTGVATGAVVGGEAAIGGGVTAALAAIPVYGWIALAVLAVLAWASGNGETRSGASYAIGPDGKAIKTEGPSGGEVAAAESRGAIEATAKGIQTLMVDLGSSAKLSGFVAGLETSENGKGFAFAGGQIGGQDFGITARDKVSAYRDMNPEEAVKAYGVELQRATLQAVQVASGTMGRTASAQVGTGTFADSTPDGGAQIEIMRTEVTQLMTEAERTAAEAASGIPLIIRNILRGVDLAGMEAGAVTALMDNINAIVAGVKAVGAIGEGTAMKNLVGLSFEAANGLVQFSGGLDQLKANLDAAYPLLYSESERAAAQVGAVAKAFDEIGVAMPAGRAALRAMIEGQDLNTIAGQKMAAALYSLVPAFDSAANAAAATASKLASVIGDYASSSEVRAFTVSQIQRSLADAGLNLTDQQISGASRADARAMYEYQVAAGNLQAADAILANAQAFAGITSGEGTANYSSGSSGGGGGGGGASNPALTAWQSATAAIVQTMKDLRQTLIGSGPDSFSKLMAQFVTETAAAKAGSLAAAQDLPTVAKALVQAGDSYSRSYLDQARLTAYVINALGGVATSRGATLPSFATGTNSLPRDMVVQAHAGETITPSAFVDAQSAARDETNALLAQLVASDGETRKKLDAALAELKTIRNSSERTARVTEKSDAIGPAPARATL